MCIRDRDNVQQFTHGGGNNDHLRFFLLSETLTETMHQWIVRFCRESWEVKGFTKDGITDFGQFRFVTHRGARRATTGTKAGVGGELSSIIKAVDVLDLGDQLSSGGIADTGNGNEQVSLLLEVRMLIEMISDLTLKISDLGIEESDMLLDGLDDSGGRNARLKAIALLGAHIE